MDIKVSRREKCKWRTFTQNDVFLDVSFACEVSSMFELVARWMAERLVRTTFGMRRA